MAHVGMGQEDGVWLAKAVRPLGVGAEVGVEQIELAANVGGGVDEVDGRILGPPIDDCQTGSVFWGVVGDGGQTAGTETADVGQSGVLHYAEDNGRNLVGR
jgi:hypothetical protein